MKYALLLYDVPANWADVDEAGMAALYTGYAAVTQESHTYGGVELHPSQTAKTMRLDGDELLVTDGPFAETKELLSGLYLVEADSLEEAMEVAKRVPTLSQMGGAIEVRQIVER